METPEFKFYCSHCDQPLQCEARYAGRQIQCPACNHLIRIPNPPAGMGFTHVDPESGRTWDTHLPKGQKGERPSGCLLSGLPAAYLRAARISSSRARAPGIRSSRG